MEIKPSQIAEINKNLKELQDLIKHLIAVQLYIGGATQDEICENLSISKTTVNSMVKGIKKDNKLKAKKDKIKKIKHGVAHTQEKVVSTIIGNNDEALQENNAS